MSTSSSSEDSVSYVLDSSSDSDSDPPEIPNGSPLISPRAQEGRKSSCSSSSMDEAASSVADILVVGDDTSSSEGEMKSTSTKDYTPQDPVFQKTMEKLEPRNVSAELQQLFQHTARFKPKCHELPTRFRPFIPEYIPALGVPFCGLQIPHPEVDISLGVQVIDEPALVQSDVATISLKLKRLSKRSGVKDRVFRIEEAEKRPSDVQRWIDSVRESSKAAPQVTYTKPMPSIESLMQIWPTELEAQMKTIPLPSSDCDLLLEMYTRMICCILDIPVYDGKLLESLHLLFTLFLEFKSNPHFN